MTKVYPVFLALLFLGASLRADDDYEQGLVAKKAGQLEQAAVLLQKATSSNPENAEAWFHYGTVLGWQKHYPEALATLREGLKRTPNDFDLRLEEARVLGWMKDYGGAQSRLEVLAREFPESLDVLVMQGQVAQWRENPSEAQRIYEKVLQKDPNQVDALTGLGDIWAARHNVSRAREFYQRALQQDASPDIQQRLETLNAHPEPSQDTKVMASSSDQSKPKSSSREERESEEHEQALTAKVTAGPFDQARSDRDSREEPKSNDYEQGLAAKKAGQLEQAAVLLQKATSSNPENAEAWFHYGTVLGWQKHYPEALAALREGLKRAPNDFDLRLAEARVLAWMKDYAGAQSRLGPLAREYPESLDVLVMQGRVAQWRENPSEAQRIYEKVLQKNPNQVDALTGLGDIWAARHNVSRAREFYQRALQQNASPDIQQRLNALNALPKGRVHGRTRGSTSEQGTRKERGRNFYEQGLAAKKAGQLEQAAVLLQKATSSNPENAEAWFHYGTVLGWQKHYPEALATLREGLKRTPNDFDLRLEEARVLGWMKDYGGAQSRLEVLAREFPESLDVLVMQGQVAQWRENPAEAQRIYEKVLQKDPNQVDALTGLGDIWAARHNVSRAREFYQRALQQDASPDIQLRLDALNNLPKGRVYAGVTGSTFDRGQREDWWSVYGAVSAYVGSANVWFRAEEGERFGFRDTTFELGATVPLHDAFQATIFAGFTPDADFSPEFYGETLFRWRIAKRIGSLGSGWLLTEARIADYDVSRVITTRLGWEQELGKGWTIDARWLHLTYENGKSTNGWISRLAWAPQDGWLLWLGGGQSVESITSQTLQPDSILRSWTVFGGVIVPVTRRLQARLDLEREDVKNSVVRYGGAIGLIWTF